ncbi:MAG: MYXO-CTERM sorting domain-containing protein, partial [Polyangia bacterium]
SGGCAVGGNAASPGAVALFAAGLLALLVRARRRQGY